MAHFPVFIDLNGALVFLVGNDPVKEEKLGAFGAQVEILQTLTAPDLERNPKLVVLTTGDRRAMAQLCMARNIPVNSVDDPDNCTWFFPAVMRRGDTVVAVSSGGKAPAAAGELRRRIDAALPSELETILLWLEEETRRLRREIPDMARRGAKLRAITALAFDKNRPLTREETQEI